jgi:hydroxymethylglutaryl-CoA lyase
MYSTMIPAFPEIEFGMHLHTSNQDWYANVEAAYRQGVRRFDGVINGYGGCPMSGEEMLGNLNTVNLLSFQDQNHIPSSIDLQAFNKAATLASFTFSNIKI